MKYGIVVSEFNSEIMKPMLKACLKGFKEQNIKPDVIWVPGAVEIPLAISDYVKARYPKAVVALGCVIKGETDHYEAVCRMCSDGIMSTMLTSHTPIIFEVLMTDSIQKAKKRINKGYDAAFSAVRMGALIRNGF